MMNNKKYNLDEIIDSAVKAGQKNHDQPSDKTLNLIKELTEKINNMEISDKAKEKDIEYIKVKVENICEEIAKLPKIFARKGVEDDVVKLKETVNGINMKLAKFTGIILGGTAIIQLLINVFK